MGWAVTIGDLTIAEEEITVDEAVDICALAAGGWEVLDPMHSPNAAAAIITVIRVSRQGEDMASAMNAVRAMPVVALVSCITKV